MLWKICLLVIGWGNLVIIIYKKKLRENWICWWIWKFGGIIFWYKKKNVIEIYVDFFFLLYVENYVFVVYRLNKWCIWFDWLGFWLYFGWGN